MKKIKIFLMVSAIAAITAIITAIFLLWGGNSGEKTSKLNSATISGQVVKVLDGDTITVSIRERKYRIRLYGIDAPELSQNYGKESKQALQKLIDGKRVSVEIISSDRYGRLVGIVSVSDINTNLSMVKLGWAWHYKKYSQNNSEFADAEKSARTNKLGLCQNSTSIPPWEYRHQK